jgi:excisionase family DNA binding protein
MATGLPEVMEVVMTKTGAPPRLAAQAGGAQTPIPDPLRQALEDLLRPVRTELELIRAAIESRRKAHLTVEEVAELTGRSAYTVRRWISEKKIKAIRISGTEPKGRLLIPREEVDALVGSGLGAQVAEAVLG